MGLTLNDAFSLRIPFQWDVWEPNMAEFCSTYLAHPSSFTHTYAYIYLEQHYEFGICSHCHKSVIEPLIGIRIKITSNHSLTQRF